MKTIKQWFETFEDAEIRKRALDNMENLEKDKLEPNNINDALDWGFCWRYSEEGHNFWLYIENHDNPASVKFDEVKHLIKND